MGFPKGHTPKINLPLSNLDILYNSCSYNGFDGVANHAYYSINNKTYFSTMDNIYEKGVS